MTNEAFKLTHDILRMQENIYIYTLFTNAQYNILISIRQRERPNAINTKNWRRNYTYEHCWIYISSQKWA